MGLGIGEAIIGILALLFGGAMIRGNIHKKTAEKQAERAEKAEIESVLVKEQNSALVKVQQIKDKAHDKENEIDNSVSTGERVPLGVNGVHDGGASSGSGTSDL